MLIKSIQNYLTEIRQNPLNLLIGTSFFMPALLGMVVSDVASSFLALVFICSLLYVRYWLDAWRMLSQHEKLLILGLVVFALSGYISYLNVSDDYEFVKQAGRYTRFLLIVPVFLFLVRMNVPVFKYFIVGVVLSGPVYFAVSINSLMDRPDEPVRGAYHHIMFGDWAMLSAAIMMVYLLVNKRAKAIQASVALSILFVLFASIMSHARGSWIALPVILAVLVVFSRASVKKSIARLLGGIALVSVLIWMSPVSDLINQRYSSAIDEVNDFYHGENYSSSIGARLAMWHIALDIWKDYPIIGAGLGDFDDEINVRKKALGYDSMAVYGTTHNIYLQSLSTTGTLGFVSMMFALYILPFTYFHRCYSRLQLDAGLYGMVVISAYSVFGLTATLIDRAPVVSMYLFTIMAIFLECRRSAQVKTQKG